MHAAQEAIKHGLINATAGLFFIGADRDHAGRFNGRPDGFFVDAIEVDVRAAGRIRFAAEGHEDEAERLRHGIYEGTTVKGTGLETCSTRAGAVRNARPDDASNRPTG